MYKRVWELKSGPDGRLVLFSVVVDATAMARFRASYGEDGVIMNPLSGKSPRLSMLTYGLHVSAYQTMHGFFNKSIYSRSLWLPSGSDRVTLSDGRLIQTSQALTELKTTELFEVLEHYAGPIGRCSNVQDFLAFINDLPEPTGDFGSDCLECPSYMLVPMFRSAIYEGLVSLKGHYTDTDGSYKNGVMGLLDCYESDQTSMPSNLYISKKDGEKFLEDVAFQMKKSGSEKWKCALSIHLLEGLLSAACPPGEMTTPFTLPDLTSLFA